MIFLFFRQVNTLIQFKQSYQKLSYLLYINCRKKQVQQLIKYQMTTTYTLTYSSCSTDSIGDTCAQNCCQIYSGGLVSQTLCAPSILCSDQFNMKMQAMSCTHSSFGDTCAQNCMSASFNQSSTFIPGLTMTFCSDSSACQGINPSVSASRAAPYIESISGPSSSSSSSDKSVIIGISVSLSIVIVVLMILLIVLYKKYSSKATISQITQRVDDALQKSSYPVN